MLQAQNVGVHFAGNYLFDGVTFRINKGDRVGLAGKNGAGKSTLLKILSKKQNPTEGEVVYEGQISVGYLSQDIDFEEGRTVWEEAQQAFEQLNYLQQRMDEVNHQLATRTDYESDEYHDLIHDISHLTERYTMLGGYTKDADIEKVLKGLGFKNSDFNRLTSEFSGGWRMRVELAKLLLQKHDVMLLDEPTNHLDIDSILWLEDFLKSYEGAVILVSHDKLFLDNVTNRTLEVANKRIHDYKANYTKYIQLRDERREQLKAEKKNQEQFIKHTEQLIDKFRAKASKASTAKSLQKKLERIDIIEVENEDVHSMNINFEASQRSGKVVFNLENVKKAFGDHTIFSNVNLEIVRGEKVAFVGQNGQGKTTLARCIVGELDFEGKIKHGHNVEVGYFAQNQHHVLVDTRTVLEEAEHAANENTRPRVRDVLGAFLFSGEAAEKKVKVLSGGERNRLALAKLLLHPSNVLIMDEPTNHLDIQSKEILKNALNNYEGTLILVSHDREFLSGLADKIVEFKEGEVKEFLGNIDEYLEYRKASNMREIEKVEQKKETTKSVEVQPERKEDKRIKNKISNLEAEIAQLEEEIANLEQKFMQENPSEEQLANYEALKNNLQEKMQNWEDLSEQL
ncbi:ribosomal protection-like ABC-F family protein [Ornithobacterium rhinotracheale]|nr:ATP-binding cassette domain-containing protein [Ornithobacterium rhinotracheale]MCK0195003.1 ATP-binding cassette domain-containing protein [Ornithobacterium rhinotracheale]UOH62728.1 ATP-binding cassette domain-containing protein [Ornithobacterium rhinotracheale]UOH65065.1 ATP-binding cassette domain-containing protein [Ornithobacterium rhinotracheale]UVD87758.1 ATP-binding cassette domain-containing protein [Ornithobacterium rhinotracheale]